MDSPPISTEHAANASASASASLSLSVSVSVSNSSQIPPINKASASSSSSSSLHDRPLALDDYSFPPGFKFNPTDDELIVHYLTRKICNNQLPPNRIVDINVYKYSPSILLEKYGSPGAQELYCFTPREKKYPKGTRPNRKAGDGYWKATSADKVVVASNGVKVGWKKNLVYYIGRPPGGSKTSWVMHEFRIANPPERTPPCVGIGNDTRLDDCVLCRIFQRGGASERSRNVAREAENNENENKKCRDPVHGMKTNIVNASTFPQSYTSLDSHHHYRGCTGFNCTNLDSQLESPASRPSRETHFKRPQQMQQAAAPLAFFPLMGRDLHQQSPSIESSFRGLPQQPPSAHFRGLHQPSHSMQQVTQLPPPMKKLTKYFHQPLISDASEWQPYIPLHGDMNWGAQLFHLTAYQQVSNPTEYQETFNSTASAMGRNMNTLDSSAYTSLTEYIKVAVPEARNMYTLDSSAYQEPAMAMGMGSNMNTSAQMLRLTEYKNAAASEANGLA